MGFVNISQVNPGFLAEDKEKRMSATPMPAIRLAVETALQQIPLPQSPLSQGHSLCDIRVVPNNLTNCRTSFSLPAVGRFKRRLQSVHFNPKHHKTAALGWIFQNVSAHACTFELCHIDVMLSKR